MIRTGGGTAGGNQGNGSTVICNAPVTGLSRGTVWHVETPAGRYEAPVVVNAAGAWATPVAALAGARPIEITPKRRSAAMVMSLAGHDPRAWPMFLDAEERFYARPMGGGLMVSPADEIPVPPQDIRVDKYDEVLAEGLWRYEQRVTVPVTRVDAPWAGLRSFSPDGEPVAGFDTGAEGFFWLAGQGGYGFQTAPALSEQAARLILGQGADAVMQALSPARFDDELTVVTTLEDLTGARIVLRQEVVRGEEVLFSAFVTLVALTETGKPARLPADVRRRLG